MEEIEWLASLKKGNVKSMELLFNQYYTPLTRYAQTLVCDIHEAEDIVQQLFVSVWEKRQQQEINTSVRAFLYKSVYHASLNVLKHQKVKTKFQLFGSEDQDLTQNEASELIETNELEQQIKEALKKLPPACATVFKLSREENLKYKEIAQHLEISIKTVENQMGKALSILRTELSSYLSLFFLVFLRVFGY